MRRKKGWMICIIIMSVLATSCAGQDSPEDTGATQDNALKNLSVKVEPIEENPFALPTMPPESTDDGVAVFRDYEAEVLSDELQTILDEPKIVASYAEGDLHELLDNTNSGCDWLIYDDVLGEEIVRFGTDMGDLRSIIPAYDTLVGEEQTIEGNLCAVIKFRSLTDIDQWKISFYNDNYGRSISINEMEEPYLDIDGSAYQYSEEERVSSNFALKANAWYYMLVLLDKEGNLLHKMWQKDNEQNTIIYQMSLIGDGKKRLDYGITKRETELYFYFGPRYIEIDYGKVYIVDYLNIRQDTDDEK